MKKVTIILILILTATFVNAQSNVVSFETINNTVSVSEVNDETTADVNTVNEVNENEAVLIDAEKVKESVARSSDIRIYLNREKNVNNINLLFANINKQKSA
jgi:hypothetical protein